MKEKPLLLLLTRRRQTTWRNHDASADNIPVLVGVATIRLIFPIEDGRTRIWFKDPDLDPHYERDSLDVRESVEDIHKLYRAQL